MTIKKPLLLLSAIAILFSACQNQHTNDAPKTDSALSAKAIIDNDSLSYEIAKQYVANYAKHAGTVDSTLEASELAKPKKKPNTRCIWFSADRLEALVKKIKAEGGDGIRFYLSTYDTAYPPNFVGGHKPPKIYWGYNTLIMVSTKDSTNKVAEHFHRDYYTSKSNNSNKPNLGFILGNTPENRGELCPPPKNCGTVGATLLP